MDRYCHGSHNDPGGRSTGSMPFDVEVREHPCYEAAYRLGCAQ